MSACWATLAAVSGTQLLAPADLLGGRVEVGPVVAAGLVSTAGGLGSLAATGWGQRWAERVGTNTALLRAARTHLLLAIVTAVCVAAGALEHGGVITLMTLAALTGGAAPGTSGLFRAWWVALADRSDGVAPLPRKLADRGVALEPVLGAFAYTVGPALAAPLILLSPWLAVFMLAAAAVGLNQLRRLPDPYLVQKKKASLAGASPVERSVWWMAATYAMYHVARPLLTLGAIALLLECGRPELVGLATAAPSAGNAVAGILFAARKDPGANLERSVLLGLAGQAVPTALLALWAWTLAGQVPGVATAGAVLGLGVLAGILKAPVPAAVYPLAAERRPSEGLGRASARLAQGMTAGGMVGPVIGATLVAGAGTAVLLPASVGFLGLCAAGVRLDPCRPLRRR